MVVTRLPASIAYYGQVLLALSSALNGELIDEFQDRFRRSSLPSSRIYCQKIYTQLPVGHSSS